MSRLSKVAEKRIEQPELKNEPMFSSDEHEIKLGRVFYRVSWSSGWNYDKSGKAEIEAVRVFNVNNSARLFRVRCAKGCEDVYKMGEGCSTQKLYAVFNNAVKALREKIAYDIKKFETKRASQLALEKDLHSEHVRVGKMRIDEVKLPKELAT